MSTDDFKKLAAQEAAKLVEDGMALGLGTGSTANHFIAAVGALVAGGMKLRCIGTSARTEALAKSFNIALSDFGAIDRLDLTVDGADEIDPGLALIKGGGGAHLREKIVAANSRRLVIIADEGKCVARLGRFPLPVEIVPFAEAALERQVKAALLGAGVAAPTITRRKNADGSDFRTDCGNWILDCACGEISDPARAAAALDGVAGVVEHGLFIAMADSAIVAGPGGVRHLRGKAG